MRETQHHLPNRKLLTFRRIPPGVATANQLSLIGTRGLAEVLMPDVLLIREDPDLGPRTIREFSKMLIDMA